MSDDPIKAGVVDAPNPAWKVFHEQSLLTIPANRQIREGDKAFTIGSCFAEEVRYALAALGHDVLPRFESIELEKAAFRIDTLPSRPHMNFYNTFTIRQEIERVFGIWSPEADDFWKTEDLFWGGDEAYQDPYRRLVFGRTPEDLSRAQRQVNHVISQGVHDADIYFMTLGLTEVWKQKHNGKVVCSFPKYGRGGGNSETYFHMSTYEENFENMDFVVGKILENKPTAHVYITVSPVPLQYTFSGTDVYTANMESKSILRAVAGAVTRKYENATYFPSFEIASLNGRNAFQKRDGRHVKRRLVELIMNLFAASQKLEGGTDLK